MGLLFTVLGFLVMVGGMLLFIISLALGTLSLGVCAAMVFGGAAVWFIAGRFQEPSIFDQ